MFVLDVKDAKGYGGIASAFLSSLCESDLHDCAICVFDVDGRIKDDNSPYCITRKQLMSIFQNEVIVDAVSFCTNPNILQYFLLAADSLNNVSLTSTSKNVNAKFVHKYWPSIASMKTDELGRKIKSGYIASKWQLDEIKYSIINGTYPCEELLKMLLICLLITKTIYLEATFCRF